MSNDQLLNTIALLVKNSKDGVEVVISAPYDGDDYQPGDVEILSGEEYLDTIKEYPWLLQEAIKRGLYPFALLRKNKIH